MFNDLNWVAIGLAAVANFAIGSIWYSPVLFANRFVKAMGYSPAEFAKKMKSANMMQIMGLSFVSELLQAFVLAYLMMMLGTQGVVEGAMVGFWAWLGFVVVTQFTHYLYENQNRELLMLGAGYQLVALVTMGAILGAL